MDEKMACGTCWPRRGRKHLYDSFTDLSRHATLAHPGLGFVPVKLVRAV